MSSSPISILPQVITHKKDKTMLLSMAVLCAVAAGDNFTKTPQTNDDAAFAQCMDQAMKAAQLDTSLPDWNCGGTLLDSQCLEKGWIVMRDGLVCLQQFTVSQNLHVFDLPGLETPAKSSAAYDCMYNRIKNCPWKEENGFCANPIDCLDQIKCIMTAMNICFESEIWPIDRLKTREEMEFYPVDEFNRCSDKTAQSYCGMSWSDAIDRIQDAAHGGGLDQAVAVSCAMGVTYTCGVQQNLFPYYSNFEVPFLSHAPNPQCIVSGSQKCFEGATAFCNDRNDNVAECLQQLQCILAVVNDCGHYNFIPLELIPVGISSDDICYKSYNSLCNKNGTMCHYGGYEYECQNIQGLCAGIHSVYCSLGKPAIEELKREMHACVSNVRDCGFVGPTEEWACSSEGVAEGGMHRCWAMSNCALTGANKCINLMMHIAFPEIAPAPTTSTPTTSAPLTPSPGSPTDNTLVYVLIVVSVVLAIAVLVLAYYLWFVTRGNLANKRFLQRDDV